MFNLKGDDSMSSFGFPSDLRTPFERAEDELFVQFANVIASGQQFLVNYPGRSQPLHTLIRDIIQNLPVNATQLASSRDRILESLSATPEELSPDHDDNDGDHTPAPPQPSYVPGDYVPGGTQDTDLSTATPHSQGAQDRVPSPRPSDVESNITTAGESAISPSDGVDVHRASTPSARSPAPDTEAGAAADEPESVESPNNVDQEVAPLDPPSPSLADGEVTGQVGATSANVDAASSPAVSRTSAALASAVGPSDPAHHVPPPAPANEAGASPLAIALPLPATHAPRRLVRTYAFIAYKSSNADPERRGAPLQRENAIADISAPGLLATRRPEYFNAGGKRVRDEDDDDDNDNDDTRSKRHCAVMKELGPSFRRDFDGRIWHVPAPSRSPSPTGKPQKKVTRRRVNAVASGSTPGSTPSQATRPPRPFLTPKVKAKKRGPKVAEGKGKKRTRDSDDEDSESPVTPPAALAVDTQEESSPSKKLKRSHDSDVAEPLDQSQAESSTSSAQLRATSESIPDNVAPPSTTEEPTAAASSGRVTRSSSSSASLPRSAPSSSSRETAGSKKGKKGQSKATVKPPSPK